jgi:hypothetical protein
VCDLPFAFFSDPELMPILAAALVAVCYGCDQNRSVVQQEISTDMLRSLLKSCHMSGLTRSDAIGVDSAGTNNPSDSTGYDGSMKYLQSDFCGCVLPLIAWFCSIFICFSTI